MAWWHEQLRQAGWRVATEEYRDALRNHRESMLKLHDWDWFVARKCEGDGMNPGWPNS